MFSRDGTKLLSPVGNRVNVFDLVNNRAVTFPYQHRKPVANIALNQQETLLLSVDIDGRAILVNYKSHKVLHHFNFKEPVRDLKFSNDSTHFAVATTRFVQVWKTPDVTKDRQFAPFVRHRVYAGHFADVVSLTWSRDSRFVISTSKDLTAKLFSLSSAEASTAMTFAGHKDTVVKAFFNATQEVIYSVSKDGALFQWEYTKRRSEDSEHSDDSESETEQDPSAMGWRITAKHYFFSEAKVKCAAFHEASSMLVVGFKSGEFRLYELPGFTLVQQLSMGQNDVSTIEINRSGEWLAFGSRKLGQLLVYEWQSESYILKQQGHFDSTNTLAYSPDGAKVVTGSDDGKIKIWDVVSGFCLATFDDHASAVTSVRFSKKGNVLFSASFDGTVKAYDLIRYRNFRTFTATKRLRFNSLAVDPSGEIVCGASEDSFDIYVWSVQTGQLLDTLAGHQGPISAITFGVENNLLASASWDKTVRIWNIFDRSQHVEPLEIHHDVLAIAMRPDSQQIAVSTLNGQLQFWDIELAKQVANIDTRKDILSGRFLNDKFEAKNSARSKFFTTINYSFDGLTLIAGGFNNSICLYDISNEVLLRRFRVSLNMLLDGTQEYLNSSKMTEFGSIDLIDDAGENSDFDDRVDNSLPGSKRGGDPSLRNVRPEIRISAIQFSPTAMSFAAASTEGVLIYSIDDELVFDPFNLDIDITPETIEQTLAEKEYLNALIMAFRLNENYLIEKVYESIPIKDIKLIAASLPNVYVDRLLNIVGAMANANQHIEYHLLWIKEVISAHGKFINKNKASFAKSLRLIQRFIQRIAKDVVNVSRENEYSYLFLESQCPDQHVSEAHHQDGSQDEDESHNEAHNESQDDQDMDDNEGWITSDKMLLSASEDEDD